MIYSILSTLEFGKGRISLLNSKISYGNYCIDLSLFRKILEWTSSLSSIYNIKILFISSYDKMEFFPENVSVVYGKCDDLSDLLYLKNFNCILISGLKNNLSPLLRSNIRQYVLDGFGLLTCDILIEEDNIELFDDISPVFCSSSGNNISSGKTSWSENSADNYIFSTSFLNLKIPIFNTISEINMSSEWNNLYVLDSSSEINPEIPVIINPISTIYSSSDYDISGSTMIAYFVNEYKNGIMNIEI